MKKYLKKGFTLIELIVVITIMVILLTASYWSYNFHQNKIKLKIATREVSQSLYDSRSMAISWMKSSDKNSSIWLYLSKSWLDHSITTFSYPYDIDQSDIDILENSEIKIINSYLLKNKISFNDLSWKDNLLFFFEAITWDTKIFTFEAWSKTPVSEDEIDIIITYWNSNSVSMQKKLIYFTKTNIVDYE